MAGIVMKSYILSASASTNFKFHLNVSNHLQTHKAMETGRTGRVQVEDIVFLVRKDHRKFARVKDLLTMNEELKKARKAFDEVKYAGVS